MDDFVTHFCREQDGSWRCTSPATLWTENGRIQVTEGSRFYPGTIFMGVDLAAWLDQRLREGGRPCHRGGSAPHD